MLQPAGCSVVFVLQQEAAAVEVQTGGVAVSVGGAASIDKVEHDAVQE